MESPEDKNERKKRSVLVFILIDADQRARRGEDTPWSPNTIGIEHLQSE
jgi:hypothetical protein